MPRQKRNIEEIDAGITREEIGRTEIPTATEHQRHRMIAETAYLIAEQRGFQGSVALDDWLRAESEVSSELSEFDPS